MEKIIEFINVSKTFNKSKKALDNISFSVLKGQFHGFIGANGAGKTTSIRTLLGFYPNYEGQILVNGIDTKSIKFKEKIGYIPEKATFPKSLSVLEYLIHMAAFSGIENKKAKELIFMWLDKFNIDKNMYSKKGNQLSSGEQKKILLIQALVNEPSLLILDEPAANLDPKVRNELYHTLHQLNKEKSITIFISSHILAELEQYIDSFTVMESGKIISSSTLQEKREETSNNSFKIISNQLEQVLSVLTSLKSKFEFEFQQINKDTIFITTNEQIFKQISLAIISSDISVEYLGKNIKSLNEIYFDVKNFE